MIDANINLTISKYFYNNLYNTVGDKLQEFLVNSPMSYREAINKDMQLNGWLFLNFEEQTNSQELLEHSIICFILIVIF